MLTKAVFKADFAKRIPQAFQPIQDQLFSVQNQLDFISSSADNRITTIAEEFKALKKEKQETTSLLVAYAERLEQMDHSYAVLNQTIIGLSISLQAVVDDAKNGKEMKEVATGEAAEQAVEEAATRIAQQMADEEAEEKAAEERLRKKAVVAKKKKKVVSPSDQPTADITKDIYLAVFHIGALLEILGDPVQLAARQSKRQQAGTEKQIGVAQRVLAAAEKRKKTFSKRSAPTSFQMRGLLKPKVAGARPKTGKWVMTKLNDRWKQLKIEFII